MVLGRSDRAYGALFGWLDLIRMDLRGGAEHAGSFLLRQNGSGIVLGRRVGNLRQRRQRSGCDRFQKRQLNQATPAIWEGHDQGGLVRREHGRHLSSQFFALEVGIFPTFGIYAVDGISALSGNRALLTAYAQLGLFHQNRIARVGWN